MQLEDFTMLVPNLRDAASFAAEKYSQQSNSKLKMVDCLMGLALSLFFIQVAYGVLVCRDPFNSFIAGSFCALGVFGLTASLRLQLSSKDFNSTPARMMFEYILGCLCLFFACFLLMG